VVWLWLSALFLVFAYHRERRKRLDAEWALRGLRCDCGAYSAYQTVCVTVDGWHHGHGAGHCHPVEAVDL
jgi:hypothetical protein